MGLRGHTAYKFRHWTLDPDGERVLDWANGIDLRGDRIVKGSKQELEVIEAQDLILNALTNEGEVDILDVYFEDQAVRSSLYLRLYNDMPTESDTLATLTGEVSGTGYAGITVTRGTDWSAPAHDTGTTTSTKTFTAGGTWTAASELVLATVASGTAGLFLASAALSQSRTLGNGDTLDVTLQISLE